MIACVSAAFLLMAEYVVPRMNGPHVFTSIPQPTGVRVASTCRAVTNNVAMNTCVHVFV